MLNFCESFTILSFSQESPDKMPPDPHCSSDPVSYTHLDVYKRQLFATASHICFSSSTISNLKIIPPAS